jgi:Secretion system C-terminal sorting domain
MRKLLTLLLILLSTSTFAQTPTVFGDTMLCPNGTGLVSTQTYDSYQWFVRYFGSSTTTAIPGANSQSLVIDYGNYAASYLSVEVTLGGNDSISPEFFVDGYAFAGFTVASSGDFTIGPLGESVLCPGDTMYFEVLLPYDTNITWLLDGDTIPGITSTILTVTGPGNYYVTGAPSVCPDFIQGPGVNLEVIDCTVDIDENAAKQFSIYPNPAENYLQLSNAKTGDEFIIHDAIGKVFMNDKITSAQMTLNIESLSSGLYFIKCDSQTRIFIKE